MKHIKLLFLLCTILLTYLIYKFASDQSIIYIALGDSFALGENPYGEISYGYADYLANYFKKENKLKFYTKKFSEKNNRIKDIYRDILLNKEIEINGRKLNLKSSLRESDYISLSVGAKDIMDQMNSINDTISEENTNYMMFKIEDQMKSLLKEIKKYNRNIYLIGYYNLYPNDKRYQNCFQKLDDLYQKISKEEKIHYISLYHNFPVQKYLPNPLNVHPSIKGYQYIYQKILQNIKN